MAQLQKENAEILQRCQKAEEKARKAAAGMNPLTSQFYLPKFTGMMEALGIAHLQLGRSPLIAHMVRRRLTDLISA